MRLEKDIGPTVFTCTTSFCASASAPCSSEPTDRQVHPSPASGDVGRNGLGGSLGPGFYVDELTTDFGLFTRGNPLASRHQPADFGGGDLR